MAEKVDNVEIECSEALAVFSTEKTSDFSWTFTLHTAPVCDKSVRLCLFLIVNSSDMR